MGKVKRLFCYYQNFVPNGLSPPARGYIHVVKHEKMYIKSDFKAIFFKPAANEQSDKGFLLISKVCPQGVVCPCPGAIYIYKIIKNVYKIRFLFLNLQQMGKVIRLSVDIKFFSQRGCLSLPWGYIHV